jgi:hypothetical protein
MMKFTAGRFCLREKEEIAMRRPVFSRWGFYLAAAFALLTASGTANAKPVKVYLLAGQSNMVGFGENNALPTELKQPQTDVQIFHGGGWGYLRPGLGKDGNSFGPEITFGRDMADALPHDRIALIKVAWGGTNLMQQWRPPLAGGQVGPLYTDFMNIVTGALASLGSDYEIAGMAWMQGESDSNPLEWAEAYEQNLTFFIQSIRLDLNVPNMPFVIGQITDSSTWIYGAIVMQAQYNVSETVPNTAMVYTSDLPHDGVHYYTAGVMTLGSRFAEKMLEFLKPARDFNDDGIANFLDYAILTAP